MVSRSDLSFKAQRDALLQAAELPQETILGQSYQAANGLLAQASEFSQGKGRKGMSQAEAAALMGRMPAVEMPSKDALNKLGTPSSSGSNFNLNERQQQIYDGLRQRGLTDIQARGSILNFMDESGLVSNITEKAPNVHGTRGQGLYQLTDIRDGVGRRTDYLNFMKANGRNDLWSDDSQLDFFIYEIQNSEKGNWAKFANAPTVGEFASGMVEHFLRPAQKHRIARQQKYLAM